MSGVTNGSSVEHKQDAKERSAKSSTREVSSEGSKKEPDDREHASSSLSLQTQDLTSHVAKSAENFVRAEVEKRTKKGATDLGNAAAALRQTTHVLEDNMVAPYIEKAAEQIERASDFLHEGDLHQLKRSVERFAKREPLLFLGGAFAMGLPGARFLKSSSHAEEEPQPTKSARPKRKRQGSRS